MLKGDTTELVDEPPEAAGAERGLAKGRRPAPRMTAAGPTVSPDGEGHGTVNIDAPSEDAAPLEDAAAREDNATTDEADDNAAIEESDPPVKAGDDAAIEEADAADEVDIT